MSPQQLWDQLVAKWNALMQKADALLKAFNAGLDKVAKVVGWIAEKAAQFWNDHVVPKWQEALDWMSKHINVFGAPWDCFSRAASWREDVGRPVSERSGLSTKGQLDVDGNWEGSASQAYQDRLGQQEKAIAGVSTQFAEPIASALTKVGAGIITWWLAIIVGMGVLTICLLTATGAAVSILGLPAVPPAVLLGWAAFIGGLITGTTVLTTLCLNAKGDLSAARNKLTDYPGGAWPTFG